MSKGVCIYVPPTDIELEGTESETMVVDGLPLTVEYAKDMVWRDVLGFVGGLKAHLVAVCAAIARVVAKLPDGVEYDPDYNQDFWITVDDMATESPSAKLEIPGLSTLNGACEITWGYMLQVTDVVAIEAAIRDWLPESETGTSEAEEIIRQMFPPGQDVSPEKVEEDIREALQGWEPTSVNEVVAELVPPGKKVVVAVVKRFVRENIR